jgi:hypothetical protein
VLFQDESITRSQEIDMAYMLLVMEGPGDRDARTESELRASYDRMLAFSAELKSRGLLTLSQALSRPSNAARVSMQGDRALVRDGPFTEAREVVGGIFLLTCATRAEAVAIARECPAAAWATIEVRELGPCFQ